MAYEIVKGRGKTMWVVHDTATGDCMRFYRKSECEAWIAREEQRAPDHEFFAQAERAARLARVRAYLARRALRPVQLGLGI